jgi:hypothetical protein
MLSSKEVSEDALNPLPIFLTCGRVPMVKAIELQKWFSQGLKSLPLDSAYFNTARIYFSTLEKGTVVHANFFEKL